MLSVKFEVNPPLEYLKYWIKHIESSVLDNMTEFYDKWAGRVLKQEIAMIFATEGYGQWAPLSPDYAQWKQRHYPGRKMLRLSNSYFKAATIKGARGNLCEIHPDKMIWGVDLETFASAFGAPYPYYMEKGVMRMTTKKGLSVTPARPVFYLAENSKRLQDALYVAFNDYLKKAIYRETHKYFMKEK